jgi:hypothetical protein
VDLQLFIDAAQMKRNGVDTDTHLLRVEIGWSQHASEIRRVLPHGAGVGEHRMPDALASLDFARLRYEPARSSPRVTVLRLASAGGPPARI